MTAILTLVATDQPLTENIMREAASLVATTPGTITWLSRDKAAFCEIEKLEVPTHNLRTFLDTHKIDFFITPSSHRRKKLLLADMDATIVTAETLDELAAYAGLKDKIAAITTLAMEGKLDFESALRERVALLKNLPAKTLHETLTEMQLSKGAKTLIATMKKHGCTCVLVSGGFTFFTDAIATRVGFDANHGNNLDIENDVLLGTVTPPILDKNAKAKFMEEYRTRLGLTPEETFAIGDGANDIPMLKTAGLGIGYQPKETVRKEIANLIIHGDLTAALYAQGYADSDFL